MNGDSLQTHDDERQRFWGKYMGYVRDDKDPENRGRIRCFCPEVLGKVDDKSNWLDWALPSWPWIVHLGVGLNFIPPKNGEWGVWIEFRQGDPRFPIWSGVFPLAKVDENIVTLKAKQKIRLGVDADEPVVLGNSWKAWIEAILQALIQHKHPTGTGPSGPPLPPDLTTLTQKKAETGNNLSTYVFAKKNPDTKRGK